MAYDVLRGKTDQWMAAAGRTFPDPDNPNLVSIPHNTRFFREDLNQVYSYDSALRSWVLVVEGGSGSGPTVQESDGAPAVAGADNIQFDQSDGFVVTDLGSGDVRIDLAAIPQARISGLVADLAAATSAAEDALFLALGWNS